MPTDKTENVLRFFANVFIGAEMGIAAMGPAFHVFLSHNSKDKPAVRELKQLLAASGLTVWLDEDELRPGMPWQQLLESGINTSRSVAVLVGRDGLGPWEDEEMQAALRMAVKYKRPVIPVLLPGAPAEPELPMFLSNRTWVDLRAGLTEEGVAKLVWGITGKKPSDPRGASVVSGATGDNQSARESPRMAMTQENAIEILRRKLDELQKAEAITADPSQRFQLQEQIKEAQTRIAELTRTGVDVSEAVNQPPHRALLWAAGRRYGMFLTLVLAALVAASFGLWEQVKVLESKSLRLAELEAIEKEVEEGVRTGQGYTDVLREQVAPKVIKPFTDNLRIMQGGHPQMREISAGFEETCRRLVDELVRQAEPGESVSFVERLKTLDKEIVTKLNDQFRENKIKMMGFGDQLDCSTGA